MEEKKANTKLVFIITLIVILLGVAGYFGFKYFSEKNKTPEPTTTPTEEVIINDDTPTGVKSLSAEEVNTLFSGQMDSDVVVLSPTIDDATLKTNFQNLDLSKGSDKINVSCTKYVSADPTLGNYCSIYKVTINDNIGFELYNSPGYNPTINVYRYKDYVIYEEFMSPAGCGSVEGIPASDNVLKIYDNNTNVVFFDTKVFYDYNDNNKIKSIIKDGKLYYMDLIENTNDKEQIKSVDLKTGNLENVIEYTASLKAQCQSKS